MASDSHDQNPFHGAIWHTSMGEDLQEAYYRDTSM